MDGNIGGVFLDFGKEIALFDTSLLSIFVMLIFAFLLWKFNIPAAACIPLGVLFAYANWLIFPSQFTYAIFLGSVIILGGLVFIAIMSIIHR